VQFLPVEAFEHMLEDVAHQANNAHSKEVTFVFLGDVFDLVRTPLWLDKGSPKPWDPKVAPDAVERRANELLDKLVECNRKTFDLWQGSVREGKTWKFETVQGEPRRVYVPGNHDRIVNEFDSLRARAAQLLGANRGGDGPNVPFAPTFVSREYRTFARHGHEYDYYNFERRKGENLADAPLAAYLRIPIGELIATEIASKLPLRVDEELKKVPSLTDQERADIVGQIKVIDDVRPIGAILPWLVDRLAETRRTCGREALEAVKRGNDRVIDEFRDLPFVRDWFRKHDTLNPLDAADRLQAGLWLVDKIDIENLEICCRASKASPSGSPGRATTWPAKPPMSLPDWTRTRPMAAGTRSCTCCTATRTPPPRFPSKTPKTTRRACI
jgi:hypothetical protein